MNDKQLQAQVDDINRKLDIVLDEIEHQRRQRNELEDLRDDLLRVGADVYNDTVTELEEFSGSMHPGDALLLMKQLLRNIGNIKMAFEQLESARDFLADFNSISGDMFNDVLLKLDEFDRKGYFELMHRMGGIAETVADSFSPEDLERMNQAIPRMAGIVKRLTQPDLIEKMDTATRVFERYEFDPSRSSGLLTLLRAMMSREVRTGMLYSLGLMRETVQALQRET